MVAPLVAFAALVGRMAASTAVRTAAAGAGRAAARRVARGGVRPGAVGRLARIKGKQFLRDPRNLGLAYSMLSGSDEEQQTSSDEEQQTSPEVVGSSLSQRSGGGAGMGTGAVGGGGSLSAFDVVMPQKSSDPNYRYNTNASLSSITEQVKTLSGIATQLLSSNKKQETALIDGISTREEQAQEAILETDDASMVQGSDIGGASIEALESEADRLVAAIRMLRDQIENGGGNGDSSEDGEDGDESGEDGEDEGGISAGGLIAGGLAIGALAVGTAVNTGEVIGEGIVDASKAAIDAGEKAFSATKKAAGAVSDAFSKTASKISEMLGFSSAEAKENNPGATAEGTGAKQRIREVARPLVAEAVEKAGISDITVTSSKGGIIGAITNLLSGDPEGAGVDNASGMDNVVRALPALVDSVSRDVYYGVYGVYPEQDQMAGDRLPEVKNVVNDLITSQLQTSIQQERESTAQVESKPTPTPSMEAQSLEESPSAPQVSAPPPSPAAATTTSTDGGTGTPTPSGGGSSTGAGGGSSTGAGGGSSTGAGGNIAPPAGLAGGATPEPPSVAGGGAGATGGATAPVPASGFGAEIASASESSELASAQNRFGMPAMSPRLPAYMSTSRPNATGMGDVPEPSYMGAGELMRTVYFGAVAGAMA